MSDLIDFLGSILTWLKDLVLWVPKKVFELITDALAALASSIPAPDFIANYAGTLGSLGSGVYWFLDLCAAREGLAMVLSALLLRFALKFIPTLSF